MTVRSGLIRLTIAEYTGLVLGIPKYCPNATFTINGQTFTAPQAVTFVQALLDTVSAVETARTSVETARLAEATALATNGAIVKGIRDYVALMFGNNPTTLAAFDITPKKPRTPLSNAARIAAQAKAEATRLARGTTSKKKKAAIRGGVTGVTITPIKPGTAASTASTAATPATGATPSGSSATTPHP